MIANLHQAATNVIYGVREQKATQPSTYRQRVVADRIVILVLLLFAIVVGIFTA
ncbi:hypothetical protein [Pedobacter sp.]